MTHNGLITLRHKKNALQIKLESNVKNNTLENSRTI